MNWRTNTLAEKPGHRHEHPAMNAYGSNEFNERIGAWLRNVEQTLPTEGAQSAIKPPEWKPSDGYREPPKGSWLVFAAVLGAVFGVVAFLLSWHGGAL